MSLITEDNALGTGSASTFNFTFKYVKESDVFVSVDDVVQTLNTHYTFAPNTSSITFLPAHIPALNAKVRIYRETGLTDPAAEFFPGSAIRASDLNTNNDQVLFSAQERKERSLLNTGGNLTGDLHTDSNIIFEGATDDANETTLTVVDPTQDNTVSLPNVGGFVPVLDAAPSGQITSTVAEINKLTGVTATTAELNKLAGATPTTPEINTLSGIQATTNELNKLSGVNTTTAEFNHVNGVTSSIQAQINNKQPVSTKLTELATMQQTTAESLADLTSAEVQTLDNLTATTTELNLLGGLQASATELNTMHGILASTNELNKLQNVNTTTAEFNKLSGLNASTADLDITNNMTKATTLSSSSDTQYPTSKAVADYVTTQLSAIDGFVAVAAATDVPGATGTAVPAGVTISIADAGDIPVDTAGQAQYTAIGSTNNVSGQVTITGIPTSFRPLSGTQDVVNGVRFLIEGTGNAGQYTYHKATLKESDLVGLSDDIQDFGERYRVGPTNPAANNDAGDLFFNTGSNKMLVWNATNTAWEEVQSIGQFFEIPANELQVFANGTSNTTQISNAPASAQQILLSLNGVLQKPSSGTGTPTEGFTLSGNTITLAATPLNPTTVFGVIIGSSVNIGTPSANTVDTLQLVADSVDNTILDSTSGSEAVDTNVIKDNAVSSAKLKSDASTDANRAVTRDHIRDNAINTDKIADDVQLGGTPTLQNTPASSSNNTTIASTAYVTTAVATAVASIPTDVISEGDTKAEVVDTGTNGHFLVETEGVEQFRIDSAGAATFTAGVSFGGCNTEKKIAMPANDIQADLANYFTKTINGNTTFTISGVPASPAVYSFILEVTHTSGTITWFSNLEWNAATPPTLTAGKTHLFAFITDDGGSRWRGAALVDYNN